MKPFPVGISDFKKLIENNYLFADKTLFIKDIMEDGADVILITRPRRFGKTLNLSMLNYFLSQNHYAQGNRDLFENLNISKYGEFCKKHQHQYPVIFITFKDLKESNYKEAYAEIVELMRELHEEHKYLLDGDYLSENEKNTFIDLLKGEGNLTKIKAAIKQLSVYMKRKFKKAPIILIDEYDTPIQEAYLKGYYDKMILLMRSILGKALKDNKALRKAVLTGITRISRESLFSGLNNLEVYSVLDEHYGQYFGFTEPEVLKLIVDSEQNLPLEPIKEWYNGYQIGKYTIYNPWSIIGCLKNSGKLDWYWVHTSSNELIDLLLRGADSKVQFQFEKLLQGQIVERPISKNLVFPHIKSDEEALWSLLIYAGYLNVVSSRLTEFQLLAELAIPNKEVSSVYSKIISRWFAIETTLDSYNSFIKSLATGDANGFKNELAKYIMEAGSFFDFNKKAPEKIFQVFVLGLVVGLKNEYVIECNKESGLGRFDMIFIPKNKDKQGILMEFKTSNTRKLCIIKAQEALDQIKDKKYLETFKQYDIGSVLAIGLAFCGKELELLHEHIDLN